MVPQLESSSARELGISASASCDNGSNLIDF
jgi:hypothetical protein